MVAEDTRYRVLLVEDNKLDQMAFTRFVNSRKLPYDYIVAGSVSEAQHILGSAQFDIVISDYSLGDGTALNILESVKNVPVIVITGAGDEEVVTSAWKAGAHDYLPKDLERNYLKAIPRTIENAIKHKNMEEALDRKQKNLEAIFDATPVGMLLADENMNITHVNHAIRQMVRRGDPEIVDQQIGNALGCVNCMCGGRQCGHGPACAACVFRGTVKGVLDSGQSVHDVEIHSTFGIDGKETPLWVRMSAEPVIIDGHRYVVAAVDDITERRKAEQKLQLVEDRYRTIFENSAVAITMADEQERLISWNRFTETLLGMSREDLYLRPVESLYTVEEWKRIRACNVRQKGMQHHLETRMTRKDGRVIDVDISLSVLKNSGGKATGSIGVIRDISERKQAELKQAKLLKEVENVNQELNDFASIVSHDLKAPLRGVKTLANWILTDYSDKLDENGTEQINLLSSQVDWMYQLIDGVLEYSRVGRVKEEKVWVNLNELIPKIVEMVSPPENIAITVKSDLPVVMCEQTRITQVFQNLLSNAIKYMNKPQGRVEVGCVEQEGFWKFSVADNGPGIDEKYFDKIFKIFQTLSPRDKSESTGVGLTIIKKIVELYGGRIWLESKVGEGSTFFFTLPKQETLMSEPKLEVQMAC
ncbi:MAG: PAS domain S-box protein [Phycisphaerales bacterium]|nr:MAG: PAS domain S-box protein [Phycisphaerales bacterium]